MAVIHSSAVYYHCHLATLPLPVFFGFGFCVLMSHGDEGEDGFAGIFIELVCYLAWVIWHMGLIFGEGKVLMKDGFLLKSYGIQFYSLFDDHGMYEVQVCERNHQPGDEISVVVILVAVSQDGSMMSTVEVKLPEEGIGGLVCLKFWALGSENKKFTLSTVIYEPHRDAGISAVAFHPTRHMAVSSSYGGDFKVWVCNDEIQQKGQTLQNSGWACLAVGAYKKKPMTAAAFSLDGSVLAVAAETVITLWDPDKNVLLAVIGETLSPIVTLSFAGKSEYLVSVSRDQKPELSVWNMSKLSLSWSYRLHIEAVACAVDLLSFAVLALLPESSMCTEPNESMSQGRDGAILLFNVMDPVPVATWSVRKAKGGGLSFLQGNPSFLEENISDGNAPKEFLVYVNGDHEYVLFDPYSNEANEVSTARRKGLVELEETGGVSFTRTFIVLVRVYYLMEVLIDAHDCF
ncbi:hypothetical protein CMV_023745 [Castanea mollissima]|uniref:WD repeat-containing protein 75 second beta-propeller domain-containing protein n=1 Tax=Castanea mollissima TaxID=60419 RepID=A0A8J4QFH7_9ROSI|nr:hypothetical protein CMV_023745 [Castanea mollissima]